MMIVCCLAAITLLSSGLEAAGERPGAGPLPDVYLLMGQSNMSGRGVLTGPTPPELKPDARIRVLGNDDQWRTAQEPIDGAEGQVDAVSSDLQAGIGPGLSFAKAMIAQGAAASIILTPCAKGGSSIAQWAPSASVDTLYGSCLRRARLATLQGRLAGILWYQGETDARDEASAKAWAPAFVAMIDQFRGALGDPQLPIIVVGLGDQPIEGPYAGRYPAWATVQVAQAGLALPAQTYVTAAGLPRNPDNLHLSARAQILLGERLARGMATLRSRLGLSEKGPGP